MLVRIGDLRFREHRTREEIWWQLHEGHEGHALAITERHVPHLLEV